VEVLIGGSGRGGLNRAGEEVFVGAHRGPWNEVMGQSSIKRGNYYEMGDLFRLQ
jgi:hypothetical protein